MLSPCSYANFQIFMCGFLSLIRCFFFVPGSLPLGLFSLSCSTHTVYLSSEKRSCILSLVNSLFCDMQYLLVNRTRCAFPCSWCTSIEAGLILQLVRTFNYVTRVFVGKYIRFNSHLHHGKLGSEMTMNFPARLEIDQI
jgi:hypothetical protein